MKMIIHKEEGKLGIGVFIDHAAGYTRTSALF